MLSELQRLVVSIVNEVPEASGFALAGGGALIARGMVDRPTRDLDFFATSAAEVDEALPAIESALQAAHLSVARVHVAHGWARLGITAGGEHTELDLAHDFRLLPVETTDTGRTIATEELAIDKLLALFDRAEARDFVDFAALEPRYGLTYLCDRALEKDGGFDKRVLLERLGRADRLPADEYGLDGPALIRLHITVARWEQELTQDLRPRRRRGPDLGR